MVASENRKTALSGLLNIRKKKKDPTARQVTIWTDFYLFFFFWRTIVGRALLKSKITAQRSSRPKSTMVNKTNINLENNKCHKNRWRITNYSEVKLAKRQKVDRYIAVTSILFCNCLIYVLILTTYWIEHFYMIRKISLKCNCTSMLLLPQRFISMASLKYIYL